MAQNKKRIINLQKRAIRTITRSYITSHTEPRMKNLEILKFEHLYELQNSLLVHDCLFSRIPKQVKQSVTLSVTTSHNLRNDNGKIFDVKIPNFKSRAGCNSFRYRAAIFWNNLSHEERDIQRKELFKKKIKNLFLEFYKSHPNCENPRCRDKKKSFL